MTHGIIYLIILSTSYIEYKNIISRKNITLLYAYMSKHSGKCVTFETTRQPFVNRPNSGANSEFSKGSVRNEHHTKL